MSPLLYKDSLGVEELLDEVEIVLQRDLNDALAVAYEQQEARAQARALRRGVPYVELPVNQVPTDHYHVGNFPSLVLEEIDKNAYPFIVLTVEDYSPDAADPRNDHMNVYRESLVVHCLAMASEAEGPDAVFRRAVRMGQAVWLTLTDDPTMSRVLQGASNPVRGQHSVPWTYQFQGRGDDWWFQAVGTQYAIQTYTTRYD